MPINQRGLNKTSTRLIRENGKNVVIKSVEQGVYDPDTSTSVDVVTDYTAKAIQSAYNGAEIDGVNVLSSDVKLMLEPDIIEPKVNDLCVVNGLTYTIKNVKKEMPSTITMYYILQLRA